LTYQLPAIMGRKGLTMVISPLLALIWDQVRAMREVGVECVVRVISVPREDGGGRRARWEGHKGLPFCV